MPRTSSLQWHPFLIPRGMRRIVRESEEEKEKHGRLLQLPAKREHSQTYPLIFLNLQKYTVLFHRVLLQKAKQLYLFCHLLRDDRYNCRQYSASRLQKTRSLLFRVHYTKICHHGKSVIFGKVNCFLTVCTFCEPDSSDTAALNNFLHVVNDFGWLAENIDNIDMNIFRN